LAFGTGGSVPSGVGDGSGVMVGSGVSVNVGGGVAVGTAAWVCAITVKAATTTVSWISPALRVGVAGVPPAPHALIISVSMRYRAKMEKRFMGHLLSAAVGFEDYGGSGYYQGSPELPNHTSKR